MVRSTNMKSDLKEGLVSQSGRVANRSLFTTLIILQFTKSPSSVENGKPFEDKFSLLFLQ